MQSPQTFTRLALAASMAILTACSTPVADQVQEALESGEMVVTIDGPSEPIDTPATYDFSPGSTISLIDNRFDSFSVEGELRASLERQLRERGLTRSSRDNADYLVGYRLSSAEQGRITDAVRTMGLQPMFKTQDGPLARGALLLAIARNRTNTVVWRGTIEGAIDPTRSEKERAERIDLVVALLFESL